MQLHRFDDVADFLDRAGPWLGEREAEHNLIFGISAFLRDYPHLVEEPPFLALVADGERVVAVALRTPPQQLVLGQVDDEGALPLIVAELAGPTPDLPAVLAPAGASEAFASLWTDATGRPHRPGTRERIFRLERVRRPRPVSGEWRMAQPADRELVIEWGIAFVREAIGPDEDTSGMEAAADRAIAGTARVLYLWQDRGRPVSMVGAGGATPNGIRIGPVYTPPELRGHGYASNLTAVASQDQLDRGRRFCFLFTDLANPTSNHIYQEIGYEAVCDMDQYRFGAA